MKKREKAKQILEALKETYPDAGPELDYQNPFELLIAVILSAQCTDVRVNKVTKVLFHICKTPSDILALGQEKLSDVIHSCGFYKVKSQNILLTCEKLMGKYDGKVPDTKEALLSLPGVGNKTANVVLSNAFGVPAIAVDTHVFRVSHRLGLSQGKNPDEVERDLNKLIDKNWWSYAHHLFIFHGRRICKSQKPRCEICPVSGYCIYLKSK